MEKVIILCGPPGVGKSKVAEYISNEYGYKVLDSDSIRKQKFESPDYSERETDAVYLDILQRANFLLQSGFNVILDATFSKKKYRDFAVSLSDDWTIIRVSANPSTVKERIGNRDGISDADYEIYREKKEDFEPVEKEKVVIENSSSFSDTEVLIEEKFL